MLQPPPASPVAAEDELSSSPSFSAGGRCTPSTQPGGSLAGKESCRSLSIFASILLDTTEGVLRQRAEGDAERAQGLAGQSVVEPQNLCTAFVSQRPRLFPDQFLRAAREQNVRRAFG